MRAELLAIWIIVGCSASGIPARSANGCMLDGSSADHCIASGNAAAFYVAAYRAQQSLDLDAHESISAGQTMFPGVDAVEYTDENGVTCDAAEGAAAWGADGDQWCMRTSFRCMNATAWAQHSICLPLSQISNR